MKPSLNAMVQDRLKKSAGSLLVANSLRNAPKAALAAWHAAGGNAVINTELSHALRERQAHITALNGLPVAKATGGR